MKKVMIALLCLLMLYGCSSLIQLDQLDISQYLNNNQYEILDVDNKYLYLNTYENKYGMLYDSKDVLIFDHDGQLIYDYKVNEEGRVLDCIIYNEAIYYFTLNDDKGEYVCQLKKEDSHGLMTLNTWILEDPYNYPTFINTNKKIYYRIDNYLYDLDIIEPVMDDKVEWLFGLEEPHKKSLGYKVLNEEGLYDVYDSSNEKEPLFSHKYIGQFYLDDDYIIFNSRDNFKLYAYNKNTKKIKCIYDNVTDSFDVSHHYISISCEKEVVIIDKESFKEIGRIDKRKYDIDPIEYIYKINDDFYIAAKNGKIIRIRVKG